MEVAFPILLWQSPALNLYHFQQLTGDQQSFVVEQYGVCICARDGNDCKILLYQVEGFYVEVYFNVKLQTIRELKSFNSTDDLQPYLEQITLSGVLWN